MANILQIGATVAHCIFFWGGDVKQAYKSARKGNYEDRHHQHMAEHYKETPAWWYAAVLVVSFVLGLVVIIKENITLSAWAYVVSLLLGILFAPFVSRPKILTQMQTISNVSIERYSLCPLRKWNCNK
jgi:cytochrome bd-type quinol oxidase subunit 2